jgi:hypothetical protein
VICSSLANGSREKAAKVFEGPGEDDVLDAYAARRGTMFLRGGSL